jgi:hypothetical protein
MHIGGSLALIALGAILAFAVADSIDGVALGTIGIILMAVGALGLIVSLIMMSTARRTVVEADRPVVREYR